MARWRKLFRPLFVIKQRKENRLSIRLRENTDSALVFIAYIFIVMYVADGLQCDQCNKRKVKRNNAISSMDSYYEPKQEKNKKKIST